MAKARQSVSFSCVLVLSLQKTQYARFKMAYNGWPDRAHQVGVVWAVLAPILFYFFNSEICFFAYSFDSASTNSIAFI